MKQSAREEIWKLHQRVMSATDRLDERLRLLFPEGCHLYVEPPFRPGDSWFCKTTGRIERGYIEVYAFVTRTTFKVRFQAIGDVLDGEAATPPNRRKSEAVQPVTGGRG